MPARRSLSLHLLRTAALALIPALSLAAYLFLLKHYQPSILSFAFHVRAIAAYAVDPQFRRFVDFFEQEQSSDGKAGLFPVVMKGVPGVLLSRRLFREEYMYGKLAYRYRPGLRKLGFYGGAAHVRSEIETVDSPAARRAIAPLIVERLATASYDELGFRRADPDLARGCGERVLFLGDSFTDGLWVEDGETFANRYGRLVRSQSGIDVCPVNAGVNGYGTLEESFVLERRFADAGRPKIVMLMHFPNDVEEDFDAVLEGRLENAGEKWEGSLKYIRRIARFCRRHDAALVVAAIPSREQFARPWTRKNYQEVLAGFCRKEGIQFVDLMARLKKQDARRLYWSWDPHLTPHGHEAVAEILYTQTRSLFAGPRTAMQ